MADTNGKLAEVIAKLAAKVAALQTQVNNIANNTSRTTTTPPTASGTIVSFDPVENATSYAVLADGLSIGEVNS